MPFQTNNPLIDALLPLLKAYNDGLPNGERPVSVASLTLDDLRYIYSHDPVAFRQAILKRECLRELENALSASDFLPFLNERIADLRELIKAGSNVSDQIKRQFSFLLSYQWEFLKSHQEDLSGACEPWQYSQLLADLKLLRRNHWSNELNEQELEQERQKFEVAGLFKHLQEGLLDNFNNFRAALRDPLFFDFSHQEKNKHSQLLALRVFFVLGFTINYKKTEPDFAVYNHDSFSQVAHRLPALPSLAEVDNETIEIYQLVDELVKIQELCYHAKEAQTQKQLNFLKEEILKRLIGVRDLDLSSSKGRELQKSFELDRFIPDVEEIQLIAEGEDFTEEKKQEIRSFTPTPVSKALRVLRERNEQQIVSRDLSRRRNPRFSSRAQESLLTPRDQLQNPELFSTYVDEQKADFFNRFRLKLDDLLSQRSVDFIQVCQMFEELALIIGNRKEIQQQIFCGSNSCYQIFQQQFNAWLCNRNIVRGNRSIDLNVLKEDIEVINQLINALGEEYVFAMLPQGWLAECQDLSLTFTFQDLKEWYAFRNLNRKGFHLLDIDQRVSVSVKESFDLNRLPTQVRGEKNENYFEALIRIAVKAEDQSTIDLVIDELLDVRSANGFSGECFNHALAGLMACSDQNTRDSLVNSTFFQSFLQRLSIAVDQPMAREFIRALYSLRTNVSNSQPLLDFVEDGAKKQFAQAVVTSLEVLYGYDSEKLASELTNFPLSNDVFFSAVLELIERRPIEERRRIVEHETFHQNADFVDREGAREERQKQLAQLIGLRPPSTQKEQLEQSITAMRRVLDSFAKDLVEKANKEWPAWMERKLSSQESHLFTLAFDPQKGRLTLPNLVGVQVRDDFLGQQINVLRWFTGTFNVYRERLKALRHQSKEIFSENARDGAQWFKGLLEAFNQLEEMFHTFDEVLDRSELLVKLKAEQKKLEQHIKHPIFFEIEGQSRRKSEEDEEAICALLDDSTLFLKERFDCVQLICEESKAHRLSMTPKITESCVQVFKESKRRDKSEVLALLVEQGDFSTLQRAKINELVGEEHSRFNNGQALRVAKRFVSTDNEYGETSTEALCVRRVLRQTLPLRNGFSRRSMGAPYRFQRSTQPHNHSPGTRAQFSSQRLLVSQRLLGGSSLSRSQEPSSVSTSSPRVQKISREVESLAQLIESDRYCRHAANIFEHIRANFNSMVHTPQKAQRLMQALANLRASIPRNGDATDRAVQELVNRVCAPVWGFGHRNLRRKMREEGFIEFVLSDQNTFNLFFDARNQHSEGYSGGTLNTLRDEVHALLNKEAKTLEDYCLILNAEQFSRELSSRAPEHFREGEAFNALREKSHIQEALDLAIAQLVNPSDEASLQRASVVLSQVAAGGAESEKRIVEKLKAVFQEKQNVGRDCFTYWQHLTRLNQLNNPVLCRAINEFLLDQPGLGVNASEEDRIVLTWHLLELHITDSSAFYALLSVNRLYLFVSRSSSYDLLQTLYQEANPEMQSHAELVARVNRDITYQERRNYFSNPENQGQDELSQQVRSELEKCQQSTAYSKFSAIRVMYQAHRLALPAVAEGVPEGVDFVLGRESVDRLMRAAAEGNREVAFQTLQEIFSGEEFRDSFSDTYLELLNIVEVLASRFGREAVKGWFEKVNPLNQLQFVSVSCKEDFLLLNVLLLEYRERLELLGRDFLSWFEGGVANMSEQLANSIGVRLQNSRLHYQELRENLDAPDVGELLRAYGMYDRVDRVVSQVESEIQKVKEGVGDIEAMQDWRSLLDRKKVLETRLNDDDEMRQGQKSDGAQLRRERDAALIKFELLNKTLQGLNEKFSIDLESLINGAWVEQQGQAGQEGLEAGEEHEQEDFEAREEQLFNSRGVYLECYQGQSNEADPLIRMIGEQDVEKDPEQGFKGLSCTLDRIQHAAQGWSTASRLVCQTEGIPFPLPVISAGGVALEAALLYRAQFIESIKQAFQQDQVPVLQEFAGAGEPEPDLSLNKEEQAALERGADQFFETGYSGEGGYVQNLAEQSEFDMNDPMEVTHDLYLRHYQLIDELTIQQGERSLQKEVVLSEGAVHCRQQSFQAVDNEQLFHDRQGSQTTWVQDSQRISDNHTPEEHGISIDRGSLSERRASRALSASSFWSAEDSRRGQVPVREVLRPPKKGKTERKPKPFSKKQRKNMESELHSLHLQVWGREKPKTDKSGPPASQLTARRNR